MSHECARYGQDEEWLLVTNTDMRQEARQTVILLLHPHEYGGVQRRMYEEPTL